MRIVSITYISNQLEKTERESGLNQEIQPNRELKSSSAVRLLNSKTRAIDNDIIEEFLDQIMQLFDYGITIIIRKYYVLTA